MVALARWPTEGVPRQPASWLAGTARHKAIDIMRRDRRRVDKEMLATLETGDAPAIEPAPFGDDRLGLVFLCCHPALDLEVRLALTLRSVGGVPTEEIARLFLVPPATMAQRLVRAKRKITAAKIPFRTPDADGVVERLPDVLRVIWLLFTHGHRQPGGSGDRACSEAIRLARLLDGLLPSEPEVAGLLGLLLLVDARRGARLDAAGQIVTLDNQDRTLWNRQEIDEGQRIVDRAIEQRRPGPYQLQAAIAALHSTAGSEKETDWRQIALLYGQLRRYLPSPVVEANRAVAVAMVDGPAAGLQILDVLASDRRLCGWPQLHIARGGLLTRMARPDEATDAYQRALDLHPPPLEAAFVTSRMEELRSSR